MEYPTRLETARMYTRPLTYDDWQAWEAFMADPEATRYFPNLDNLPTDKWAQSWMQKQEGRYAEGRYGLMGLMHKDSGAFLGQCGLLTQVVDDVQELEVGYHMFPQHWRQGYAAEAAQAFRDLGFRGTNVDSIISIIHRENVASQGVARRNGMTREKATTFWTMPVYVYRITRAEWEQLMQGK